MRSVTRGKLRSCLSTAEEQLLRGTLDAVAALLTQAGRNSSLYQKATGKVAYLNQAGSTLRRRLEALLAENDALRKAYGLADISTENNRG